MHRVQYSTDLLEPNNIGVPKTSMVYDFPRNILINLENTNQLKKIITKQNIIIIMIIIIIHIRICAILTNLNRVWTNK